MNWTQSWKQRASVLRSVQARFAEVSFGAVLLVLIAGGAFGGLVVFTHGQRVHAASPGLDLTAHEWGTFTSIAGNDGHAVQWTPQDGSTDLPEFVEHLQSAALKQGLRGTVRMETPVLYFYSPHETTVSVRVAFRSGLITEWYPQVSEATPTGPLRNISLSPETTQGSISWNSVHLQPSAADEFPHDSAQAHYYAARETSATPLLVKTASGEQHEKFLFYRGVAAFPVPVSATVNSGGEVTVNNRGAEEIAGVILFERRGERVGYRVVGPVEQSLTLAPPELTASVAGLRNELEQMLVARGLYRDEAHAMVETWGDSWFEEGSRILYMVPPSFVNSILPLKIVPVPAQTVRAFVGRIEVVSPATEREIETALTAHDEATLGRFGRFFNPIMEILMERNPKQASRLRQQLDARFAVPQVAQRR